MSRTSFNTPNTPHFPLLCWYVDSIVPERTSTILSTLNFMGSATIRAALHSGIDGRTLRSASTDYALAVTTPLKGMQNIWHLSLYPKPEEMHAGRVSDEVLARARTNIQAGWDMAQAPLARAGEVLNIASRDITIYTGHLVIPPPEDPAPDIHNYIDNVSKVKV